MKQMEPIKKKYHYPADLKQDLLEKGVEIIQERGIDGLTLKSLAGSLGVTSAAMYHHYPDKTALLAAITEKRLDELQTLLTEKAEEPFKDDCIKLLVKGAMVFYDFCEENHEFLALMLGDAIRNWHDYPAIDEKVKNVLNIPLKAIKEGQNRGLLRSGSSDSLMMMMFSGVLGFTNIMFNSKTALPVDVIKQARRSFFELVCGSVNTLKGVGDSVKNDMQVFEKTFVG
jgi:AcrR family transcriptional regulator